MLAKLTQGSEMIKRTVCLIGAALGGVALSQAPEYSQQYTQRLAGAVDELSTIIERFDEDAASQDLTRLEGLARYHESPDPFLAERGISMETIFNRHAQLSTQLAQLRQADAPTRLMSMAQYFDSDVGAAALEDFQPAIPVTIEGLAHALAGLLAGYALVWGGATALSAPFRRKRPKVRVTRA